MTPTETTLDMINRLREHAQTFPSPLFGAAAEHMKEIDFAWQKEKTAYEELQEQYDALDNVALQMQFLLNAVTQGGKEWQESRARVLGEFQKGRGGHE